ncbi:unnamed protein product [Mycena citricolor]|uniref:Uncharacterized protein n=1 Tax=Mycena citricolor TaxID=2018698 RepID=A0AAD2HYV0_9AGAR|nr:unnamed protein product [Mycena citricolor]
MTNPDKIWKATLEEPSGQASAGPASGGIGGEDQCPTGKRGGADERKASGTSLYGSRPHPRGEGRSRGGGTACGDSREMARGRRKRADVGMDGDEDRRRRRRLGDRQVSRHGSAERAQWVTCMVTCPRSTVSPDTDAAALKKLKRIDAGKHRRAPRHQPSSSRKKMSWIWTVPGAGEGEEESLHDSIRVEWTRAKARKERWEEEVKLIREEMRRVLRSLAWEVSTWQQRAVMERSDLDPVTAMGASAYAAKQASLYARLSVHFKNRFSMSLGEAARYAESTDVDYEGVPRLFQE